MEATPPTIFVVDDDASLRRALARLLHSWGLQVETFASGHEFLARRIPDGPACLVLDVRLAEENGLALQEVLRTSPRRLPIIFLSGYGTIPLCVQALKAGAVNFLQKPVEESTLLEAIAQALAQDQGTHETRALYAGLAQRAATLTPREREVMALVVTGLLNKQIAAALGTSEKTIKIHRAQVMRKMQAESLAALVRMADAVDLGSEYDPVLLPNSPGGPKHLVFLERLSTAARRFRELGNSIHCYSKALVQLTPTEIHPTRRVDSLPE